jgi:membrane protein YdbS with pleckstrin-like domain
MELFIVLIAFIGLFLVGYLFGGKKNGPRIGCLFVILSALALLLFIATF